MAKPFIVAFDAGIEKACMTTKRPSISVVYPMFNEEENIERAVHFAEAVLTDMTSDYEILIINDASTDRSAEIAEALARSNPCVKVFHHERNLKLGRRPSHRLWQGNKRACLLLRLGFAGRSHGAESARCTLWSLQAPTLFRPFALTAPRKDLSAPCIRWCYNLLIRFLFPLRVKDVNFSFKLFKREVLDKIVLEAEGSFIDAELLIKGKLHGFKIVQFGVDYFPRNRGTSTLASPDVIFQNDSRTG